MVPSGNLPAASTVVRRSRWPAAGPLNVMGVFAVIRRFSGERTTAHSPGASSWTSITETPWAAWDFATISGVQVDLGGTVLVPVCR